MTDVLAYLAPPEIFPLYPLKIEAHFCKVTPARTTFLRGFEQQSLQLRSTWKISSPRRRIGARFESKLCFSSQQLPFSLVAPTLRKWNLCRGVCGRVSGRAVAASSSSNEKDGRKISGNRRASGKSKSGKKDSTSKKGGSNGQNVWTSNSPSNKKSSSSSSKVSKESSGGGRRTGGGGDSSFTSTRGRIDSHSKANKEDDKPLQALEVSSVAAASKRGGKSKEHRIQDLDETMFLRYLSPMPLIEEEIMLQREEPVVSPSWTTFCGNTSGVWRGVGAAFSPETAEFEPISLNENNEFIYDARVLSTVETLRTSEDGVFLSPEQQSLHRRVLWSLKDRSSTRDPRVVETQYIQDDEGVWVSSFIADEDEDVDDNDVDDNEELEMGYWDDHEGLENVEGDPSSEWENSEDLKENGDQSHWEYVLAGPNEYSERWQQNDHAVEGEQDAMGALEDDAGSISEDGKEWRSMWDRSEVLDGNWAAEGDSPFGEGNTNPIHKLAPLTSTAQFLPPVTSSESSSEADVSQGTIWTDVMEEDLMVLDEGLVFFQDGSYSRGPLELAPDPSTSDDDYVNDFTFKVEQCLMAGGHRRLRVVHTVSVEDEQVEVLRVAVYEEEWMGPCNMKSISDVGGHQLKLFSERPRLAPEDILGSWKVFEVEGMVLHADEQSAAQEQGSLVFSCKETAIKRKFPEMPKVKFNDDDSVDLREFSTSWLPGNLSVYVNFTDTGFLTFGVGWICEDKTRLVMERNYKQDGKLTHVSSKSEIKSSGLGRR